MRFKEPDLGLQIIYVIGLPIGWLTCATLQMVNVDCPFKLAEFWMHFVWGLKLPVDRQINIRDKRHLTQINYWFPKVWVFICFMLIAIAFSGAVAIMQ